MSLLGRTRYTYDEVCAVQTPEPTKTHMPIPHEELITNLRQVITSFDMVIENEEHLLDKEGQRYFGLLRVRPDSGRDYSKVIGIRNSHDKSVSSGLVCGSHVIVCSNLCFSGEIKLARKHTSNIRKDLLPMMISAMGKLQVLGGIQERRMESYRDVELCERDVNHFLIQSLDQGIIPSTKIPKVLQEFRIPSFQEHADNGSTLWRLMQAYTQVQKEANIFDLPAAQTALHHLLDRTAGVSFADEFKQLAAS